MSYFKSLYSLTLLLAYVAVAAVHYYTVNCTHCNTFVEILYLTYNQLGVRLIL